MNGLVGRKVGMTEFYDADGTRVGVTVLHAGPCTVIQRKTKEKEGYDAVQVGFDTCPERRTDRATQGRFKKAGTGSFRVLREFRLDAGEELKAGDQVTVSMFEKTPYVHVTGITKGQGFMGVVGRYRMRGGPAAHGHTSHRRIGSSGQRAKPGKHHRGHRMPGHSGNVQVTHRNLKVVSVRAEDSLLLLQGSIPGPNGGNVLIWRSDKKESVHKELGKKEAAKKEAPKKEAAKKEAPKNAPAKKADKPG